MKGLALPPALAYLLSLSSSLKIHNKEASQGGQWLDMGIFIWYIRLRQSDLQFDDRRFAPERISLLCLPSSSSLRNDISFLAIISPSFIFLSFVIRGKSVSFPRSRPIVVLR